MTASLTPEVLVPRLGEYLVQTGILSEEKLREALAYQARMQAAGERCLLGEALLKLGWVDREQLDHAITEQIIQLRNALEDANRHLERRVQERTAELQAALQKLSELSQLKSNFISNISHELRTPLTHIKGYLELLVRGSLGEVAAEQARALQVSQRSAAQLESLIENLILFSLAERGEMSLHRTPVDLAKIARKVIDLSNNKAVNANVALSTELAEKLPLVQADEEKISWAILQLLDNAIKFTPAGGSVRLSVQPDAGQLVMVSVTDTGIGIPAGSEEEVFKPFHQLDGSSTRRYGGTGLGLALVRDIISAHGSIIEVISRQGQGSTFRFPLLSADAQG